LGVERFMSEIRAVTNLFVRNFFATIVVSKWMGELKDGQLRLVLDGRPDDRRIENPSRSASAGVNSAAVTRRSAALRPRQR
jgi:hypothetical protein